VTTELIGILGGTMFLTGFVLVSSGRWNGRSFWYEIVNFLGSILLLYYSIKKLAYTNIVLNLVWGIVAMFTIYHIIDRHQKRKKVRKRR